MAHVVHRITGEYRESVHTPDYSRDEWLINPDLPKVEQSLWVVEEDAVRTKTVQELSADTTAREVRDREGEILARLATLDAVVTRAVEDMYDEQRLSPTRYPARADAIAEKRTLRSELATLRAPVKDTEAVTR